ncbi:MAG: nicotinamide-nucleotide amidohydrolase family protein, partial [Pygmaiobacter sp.]
TLEATLVPILKAKRLRVAVAESCTGGLLAQRITSVPGASDVFDYGAVTYACSAKRRVLGVKPTSLKKYSAVSSVVAAEMALGVQKAGKAAIGVGITGYAGPGGGDEEHGKPVGTVYVSVAREHTVWVRRMTVARAERSRVRRMATQMALDMVRRLALGLEIEHAHVFNRHELKDF